MNEYNIGIVLHIAGTTPFQLFCQPTLQHHASECYQLILPFFCFIKEEINFGVHLHHGSFYWLKLTIFLSAGRVSHDTSTRTNSSTEGKISFAWSPCARCENNA